MYTIFNKDGDYDNSFIIEMISFGRQKMPITEVLRLIYPSCETQIIFDEISRGLASTDSILNRAYMHGILNADYLKEKAISINDIDWNMAEKVAQEIKKNEELDKKIKEFFFE